ncbi:MAG: acyltransferase family protein [Myxococcaceae bacterium]|nr:acyltransferase family protein [Myxococcaceae bacterium]
MAPRTALEATSEAPGTWEPELPGQHVEVPGGPREAPVRETDVVEAEVVPATRELVRTLRRSPEATTGVWERASGALALAQGLFARTLESPGLRTAAQAAQGLAKAVRSGLGAGGSRAVDAYGRDDDLVRDLEPLTDFLYRRYWRVTVQGAELIPAGACLLVANHSGALPLDGPVLHQALLRERPELPASRWLVEDQIFFAPFFGTLLNRLGALRACPENALRLLAEGRPVIVFPEGAQGLGKLYRERYQLKRFGRGGFVKLALRAQVPIVPVAIAGAEESAPLLAKLPGSAFGLPYIPVTPFGPLPLPARWTIRFGTPVDLEGHGPESADTLTVVQRLTERTRDTIQGMLESVLRERPGVFGG